MSESGPYHVIGHGEGKGKTWAVVYKLPESVASRYVADFKMGAIAELAADTLNSLTHNDDEMYRTLAATKEHTS